MGVGEAIPVFLFTISIVIVIVIVCHSHIFLPRVRVLNMKGLPFLGENCVMWLHLSNRIQEVL